MFIPDFLISPETRRRNREHEKRVNEEVAAKAVPWTPNIKWEPRLGIQASTYKVLSLFNVTPTSEVLGSYTPEGNRVYSPNKEWFYCEKRLKRAERIGCAYGRKPGFVVFDGPVIIPAIHRKLWGRPDANWDDTPFMSLTPQEILTLRCGTRFAKGRTVLGGLGLGHQLIECSKRKQVKELVVVEQSQELVDWLFPKIKPHLEKDVEIIVGDAHKIIPTMTADAALIDIFPGYGGNSFVPCPNIKKVWCWGSQYVDGYG